MQVAIFMRSHAHALLILAAACGPLTQEQASTTIPLSAPLEPTPALEAAMVRIPEATFGMGSNKGLEDEKPVHEVRLAAFEIDATEVTAGAYARCVEARACAPADSVDVEGLSQSECNGPRAERARYPINCVDWAMADAFCRWAGKRLPTEAEWEYAACGGDCDAALGARGGGMKLAAATQWPYTSEVARTPKGAFGLYDMADNVWEWTASPYCPYGAPSCADARKVVRGGSWAIEDFFYVRLTARSATRSTTRNVNIGFRCARDVR